MPSNPTGWWSLGALALQGPNARAILEQAADVDVPRLRFFRVAAGTIGGVEVEISRTGVVAIARGAEDYRRVIEALRDGTLDAAAAADSPRLNADLDAVLRKATEA